MTPHQKCIELTFKHYSEYVPFGEFNAEEKKGNVL